MVCRRHRRWLKGLYDPAVFTGTARRYIAAFGKEHSIADWLRLGGEINFPESAVVAAGDPNRDRSFSRRPHVSFAGQGSRAAAGPESRSRVGYCR
jgi:hypothetical protein